MKTILLFFLVLTTALFIGCGGGGGSSSTTTSSSSSSSAIVTPEYEYAKDTTSLRELNNSAVNQYKDIENQLKNLTKQSEYNAVLDKFITDILSGTASADKVLSYAPRGGDRSLSVAVSKGKIDYSNYRLNGDVNGDYSVDTKDISLIKTALFNSDDAYDSNGDGKLDITDLIYTLARLNSEIAYFDFYDSNYQKLPINRRTVNEPKIVSYDGNLSEVIVVAKDSNGASAFSDTLSDIDEVWYKKSGWKYSDSTLIDESNPSNAPSLRVASSVMIRNAVRSVTWIEPEPYLTGWHFSVHYVETGGFDGFGQEGINQFSMFLTQGKDKIDSHFRKSNMGNAGKVFEDKSQYIYHIGSHNGKTNEVKADDLTYADAYTLDGEHVTIKRVVHAASVLYESEADKTLKGKINTSATLKGEITLDRIGPSPKEESFKGEVNSNEVEVKNIPLGEYKSKMTTACQCPLELGNILFDSPAAQANYSIDDSKVKVKLTINVVDSSDIPQENRTVEIEQEDCLNQGSGTSSLIFSENMETNDLGEATFEDVDIGDYKVKVDGKYIKTVHFCESSEERVVLDPKWYLKISINALDPFGSGSMTLKNFSYKCDGTSNGIYGKICTSVYNDSSDVQTSYSGTVVKDSALQPFFIYEKGLEASFKFSTTDTQSHVMINTFTGASGFNGSACYAPWKEVYSNNLANGKAFTIVITGADTAGTCNLDFKPCTKELCQ